MKATTYLLICWACVWLDAPARAQNLDFDQKNFDLWVDMRIGNGKQPSIWYCYGEVYSYPEGKLISRMEGVDLGRFERPAKDSVVQFNRKIFLYTDAASNQVLETYDGKPVEHIKYPYQVITYVLKGNRLASYVEQGREPRITRLGPGYNTHVRKAGNNWVFSSPVFLNLNTPSGPYQAYENYDFFVNTRQKKTSDRYQLTWVRYGDLPPWAGQGKSVIQLVCYRVNAFDELPDVLKNYIAQHAPLWLQPPKGWDEIRALQKGG